MWCQTCPSVHRPNEPRLERPYDRSGERWEPHYEAGAAAVERRLERHAAGVALRDRPDDRQPEPRRTAAIPVGAEKALEDLLAQLGRDARPVVLDREHDVA